MPLSINVGLSRKASKDYQSTGVSINVTAELDQALLARPEQLQQEISNLYSQARLAMEQQAGDVSQPPLPVPIRNPRSANSPAPNGNGHSRNGGAMTNSQQRAINAIARRLGVDPAVEAREVIGNELEHLSIRQASELIDHLKSLQPANGNGGR